MYKRQLLRPADAYVAEFVKHMNPLNVLRGATVMRPRAQLRGNGAGLWLDADQRYTLALDAQSRPVGVQRGGTDMPILRLETFDPANGALPPGIALVPAGMPLRKVVQLRQASGHPVLLQQDGAFAGVCDDAEMLRALSGVTRATG